MRHDRLRRVWAHPEPKAAPPEKSSQRGANAPKTTLGSVKRSISYQPFGGLQTMLNKVIHQDVLRAISSSSSSLPHFHPAKTGLRAAVEEAVRMVAQGEGLRNLLPRAQQRAQTRRNLGINDFVTRPQ